MGSGRSKLAAQALVIIDQMMKANPHYENEVQEYIFTHVTPIHALPTSDSSSSSSSSSSSPGESSDFPEARLKSRLLADFVQPSGKYSPEYRRLLRQYATVHQLASTPGEFEVSLVEGVDDYIKAYRERVTAEAANTDRHAAKERELQEELRKTWDGLDFNMQ